MRDSHGDPPPTDTAERGMEAAHSSRRNSRPITESDQLPELIFENINGGPGNSPESIISHNRFLYEPPLPSVTSPARLPPRGGAVPPTHSRAQRVLFIRRQEDLGRRGLLRVGSGQPRGSSRNPRARAGEGRGSLNKKGTFQRGKLRTSRGPGPWLQGFVEPARAALDTKKGEGPQRGSLHF